MIQASNIVASVLTVYVYVYIKSVCAPKGEKLKPCNNWISKTSYT